MPTEETPMCALASRDFSDVNLLANGFRVPPLPTVACMTRSMVKYERFRKSTLFGWSTEEYHIIVIDGDGAGQ